MTCQIWRYLPPGRGGVPIIALASLFVAGVAAAQLSKDEQKCVRKMAAKARVLDKTQNTETFSCIIDAAASKVGSAQACLTADRKNRISKRRSKNVTLSAKKCSPLPAFGYAGVSALNATAVDEELGVAEDLFGTDLDVVISSDTTQTRCQKLIVKAWGKLLQTELKQYEKCQKTGLKAGLIVSASDLAACVQDIADDPDGKIGKAASKLGSTVTKKCTPLVFDQVFPGDCQESATFQACAQARVTCRACRMISTFANLAANCDSLDDGAANDSCEDPVLLAPSGDTAVNVVPIACTVSAASLQAGTAPHQYVESDNGVTRSITANGIPNHAVGPFPNSGNPNTISAQSYSYMMPVTPAGAGEDITKIFAIATSGVVFDPATAEFWNDNPNWRYEALRYATAPDYFQSSGGDDSTMHPSSLGVDCNYAHVQPDGSYHYHGMPEEMLPTTPALTFIGWAGDGYPVFGRWGYVDANDSASGLRIMTSSYRLKSGARPAGAPSGDYDGTFTGDWEYQAGSGDLDECNGRTGVVTVEGSEITTYHYYITDSYPYVPRCFHAQPDSSFDFAMGPP